MYNTQSKYNERIGEIGYNTYGSRMKIIEYKNTSNITIQFDDGYVAKGRYDQFTRGNFKNPYDRTVYGIGYIGEGKYRVAINRIAIKQYRVWQDMIRRCYSEKTQRKKPTYKDCTVNENWHNYQNFCNWYDKNYYEIDNEIMDLDKDILIKGNKIYSPDTCIFVPNNINKLFIKSDATRGELPIGVHFHNSSGKYQSCCNLGCRSKRKHLGTFNTIEQAFYAYKTYKENLIKTIANTYKNKYSQFPEKLYNAMMDYIVEITD